MKFTSKATVIILCCLVVFLSSILYFLTLEKFHITTSDTYVYKDEDDDVIHHTRMERIEQEAADKYITKDDVVLELGGRYGTVSGVILSILNKKSNLVIVEPDKNVQHVLLANLERNGYKDVNLWRGIIGDTNLSIDYEGYSTRTTNNCKDEHDVNCMKAISIDDLQDMFSLRFNTLVADCEGCMEPLIRHLQKSSRPLHTWDKVMFEQDQPHICDYNFVRNALLENGFECIEDGFYTVWVNRK